LRNWKEIPIPENMRYLETDPIRGMPVPYVVFKDKKGVVHYKINDHTKQALCHKHGWCGICGRVLKNDTWLLGGPASAFDPRGAFVDSPMHKTCALYALQVCPYLISSDFVLKPIEEIASKVKDEDIRAYVGYNQSDARVPFFAFVKIRGYTINSYAQHQYIKPYKPYLETEFWLDGQQISKETAQALTTYAL